MCSSDLFPSHDNGGGIKTTTLAVLALTIISMLKGRKDISVFKRRIPKDNFREASGLVFLAATVIFVIVMILMMVEPFSFEDIIFESISAFGTVGLSRGITPSLSSLGKILITLLMYIGRVGPLTLIYAFAKRRNQTPTDLQHPTDPQLKTSTEYFHWNPNPGPF